MIGHYRIVSKLGEGGMGAVYRATDTRLDRDVAIKVLPQEFAEDAARMVRFEREARVLASLNHPNIAAVFGVEQGAFVMELVEGQPLAGPMAFEQAQPVIQQLIDALEYAHEKGIVHRDLKPANILITLEGRVKILDFGLAKAISEDPPAANPASSPTLTMRATQAGVIMGTAGYMAPEQARGQKVDKRADIWAFGVVVYELLTGRALFGADTVSDTLAQVLMKEPDLSAVPAGARPMLQRCLERDQRKRLRDIGDALFLLAEPQAAQAATAQAQPKRMPWWSAAAIAVLVLAAAAGWMWTRGGAQPAVSFRFPIDAGYEAVLSPDGKQIVDARSGLRVRGLDGISWRTLPNTEGALRPFWSEDSAAIAFFASGHLRRISVDGANSRTLAPVTMPASGAWRGAASGGTILFNDRNSLKALDVASGNVRTLPLQFSAPDVPAGVAFLPEGDGFVYLLGSANNGVLYRSSLSSNQTAGDRLMATEGRPTFAWNPHSGKWHMMFHEPAQSIDVRNLMTAPIDPRTGTLLSAPVTLMEGLARRPFTRAPNFTAGTNGVALLRMTAPWLPIWRLTWYDRNGNIVGAVGEPAAYGSFALSPDESRVAVQKGFPDERLWVYDLKSGAGARLSSLSGRESQPVWAPDSRSIYFISSTDATRRLIRQEAPGGSPEVICELGELAALHDITPDGRYLILRAATKIFRVDLNAPTTARKPEEIWARAGAISSVRVSPDGHWLLYQMGATAYALPYPTIRSAQEIGTMGGTWPFFSRDGRTLYAFGTDADSGGAASIVSMPIVNNAGGAMALGRSSLVFRLLVAGRSDSNLGAVTRDGSRFLSLSTDAFEETKNQVISDWTVLLKQ
jgi:predicted Ser/Thr protein kinase